MKIDNSMNKGFKAQARADLDIWESRYFLNGYRVKRDAKRCHKRALRRLSKGLIAEQGNAGLAGPILQLSVEERAKLVTELIEAVEDEPADDPAAVEQAWATELEARVARADAHPEDAIEWDDLRAKLTGE